MTYNLNHKTRIKDLKTLTEEVFTKYTALRDRTAALEDLCAILGRNSAGLRNSIFRGINLGEFTSDHLASIQAGTYKNMWVGDYFTMNNIQYVIMGINCLARHVTTEGYTRKNIAVMPSTFVPDGEGYKAVYNIAAGVLSEDDPGTAGNPYPTSNWYVNVRPYYIEAMTALFGSLDTYEIIVPTNVTATAFGIFESAIHLPTYQMITGIPLHNTKRNENFGIWYSNSGRLPYFALSPRTFAEGFLIAEPQGSASYTGNAAPLLAYHQGFWVSLENTSIAGQRGLYPLICVG